MVSITSLPLDSAAPTVTPTMSLKRKQLSSPDDEDSLPIHTKKPRVAFDPDVDVRILHDWDNKSLELVRVEVRHAIDKHRSGDSAAYDEIRQLFSRSPDDEDAPGSRLLRKYLIALMGRVSSLNKRCHGLVYSILDSQWLGGDDPFIETFIRFLGSLVSAHGSYTSSVLNMLVNNFKSLHSASSRPRDTPKVSHEQLRLRIHQVLKYLLSLVPTASGALSSILSSSYPFDADSTRTHVAFTKNVLQLIEYAPELKGEVLALVTERLVKIDVQIQADLDDLEDEDEDTLLTDALRQQRQDDIHEEDDEDDSEDDNDSVSSTDNEEPEVQKYRELKDSVLKMDAVLDVLFNYYHTIFVTSADAEAEDAFGHLLSQFANAILPTYRSRHTQFLLFHFAQSLPSLIERFAGACSHLTFDKTRPHILRLSAASYLASFIARGAHVSARVVRDVFGILGNHLDSLRDLYEQKCSGPDLHRFGAYYAISQALLYIFCFRWRDLLQNADDFSADDTDEMLLNNEDLELQWAPRVRDMLQRNIYSRLNPLKVCSPVIVTQFARIAHHLRFLYVFTLLEKNKRVRLTSGLAQQGQTGFGNGTAALPERQTALSIRGGDSSWQLDAYFPFDPYRLPRSRRWLDGDYNEWRGVPGLVDDAEKDDEDEDDDDEEDDSDANENAKHQAVDVDTDDE